MRRLNFKFIFAVVLVLLVVCASSYIFWTWNVGHRESNLRKRAEVAEQAGDMKEALNLYRKYLNQNPTDNEQYAEVALLAAKLALSEGATTADKKAAHRFLTRALRNMPDNIELRRQLVEVYVAMGRYAEARIQVMELEKRDVVDTELDFLYAYCSDAMGEYDKAIEWSGYLVGYDKNLGIFDAKLARDPSMIKAYALFANMLRERGIGGREDEQLADSAIEQMIAENPESAEAYLVRGGYLQEHNLTGTATERKKRFALAQESMRKALALDENNIDVLMGNAELALAEDDYQTAHDYLRKAREIAPEESRVYIGQARTSRLQRDSESAIEHLQAGLEVLPGDPEIILEMFDAQLSAGQSEQARAVIEQMQEAGFVAEQIGLAEAKLLMLDEKWWLAIQKLDTLRPLMTLLSSTRAAEIDSLLARCYQVLKQPDQQLAACNRLLSTYPQSVTGLQGQASALIALGRFQKALEVYQRLRGQIGVQRFDREAELRDNYMQLLLNLGKKEPKYLEQLRQIREGFYSSENVEDIDKILVKIRSLLLEERLNEAINILNEEFIEHSDNHSLQDLYLSALVRQQGPAEALKYLNEATDRASDPWEDRIDFLVRRAEWIGSLEDPGVLKKLKNLEAEVQNYDESDGPYFWKEMSKVYYALSPSQLVEVARCLNRAAESDPEDHWVAQRLFELAMQENSERRMLGALGSVADRFGKESDLWCFLQARYRLWKYDQQQDVEASLAGVEELIDRLENIRPRWHKLLVLRGDLAQREDQIEEAIDFYKESLDLGPLDNLVTQQLVELLVREGRFEESRQILARMDLIPGDMQRARILAEAMSGDKNVAREALDEPEWIESESAKDWLWRGQVLDFLKQGVAAEKSFRRAVELAPESPDAAEMLINYLIEKNRLEDAQRELRNLENRFPEQGRGAEVLARYYSRQKMMQQAPLIAEHYIKQVVDGDPENLSLQERLVKCYSFFKRTGATIAHLNALLEEKLAAGTPYDPLAIWARRTLARLLVQQVDHESFRQALGLIEANRIDGELDDKDLRAMGLAFALRREPVYRQRGLSFLEEIPPQKLTRREQLALARLYFSSGRWRDCRELMEKLISNNPKNLGLLASYVEMLVEQKEAVQSQLWLRKLQAAAPGSVGVVRLAALVADLSGKKQTAARMIKELVSKNGQPVNVGIVTAIAKIYEELELYSEAEEQYRLAADRDKSFRLDLAAYLGRRGNIDESLKICSEMLSKETVRRICSINFATVQKYGGQMTPEQIRQITDWMAYGKKEYPDAWNLFSQEAFLLDVMGRTAEGVEVFNQIPWDRITGLDKATLANNRAHLNLKLGLDPDELLEDIETAFETLGPQVELLDTRAMASLKKGDCAEAIRDLKEATLFQPDSGRLDTFWTSGTHAAWDIAKKDLLVRGLYHFHLALAYQCQDNKLLANTAMEAAQALGLEESDLEASEVPQYQALLSWLEE